MKLHEKARELWFSFLEFGATVEPDDKCFISTKDESDRSQSVLSNYSPLVSGIVCPSLMTAVWLH